MTRCKQRTFAFHRVGRREISAKFDAPAITSDAVGLLLRELEQKLGLVERFSDRFHDWRDPRFAKHSKQELLAQRIFGLALGYEDLNDHEQLRHDPLMAVLAGKREPAPQEGVALAGKSSLNRLELTTRRASRYKKMVAQHREIEGFFVDAFLQIESIHTPPQRIVLDLPTT
jgi:hypothetical protein